MAFRFKKFSIQDDRCSMKVGTDAVIIGAWTKIKDEDRILDIGTGSGVIALMLAQRSKNNSIDALEMDEESVLQARQNVLNSPWANRLYITHEKLQDYCKDSACKYDLIVSNPPYFEKALKPNNKKKLQSKHTGDLPHNELLTGVNRLLSEKGRFVVILPCLNSKRFIEMAWLENLSAFRELEIYPLANEGPRRVIYEFTRQKTISREKTKLYLRDKNGNFTEEYQQLTANFYLHF